MKKLEAAIGALKTQPDTPPAPPVEVADAEANTKLQPESTPSGPSNPAKPKRPEVPAEVVEAALKTAPHIGTILRDGKPVHISKLEEAIVADLNGEPTEQAVIELARRVVFYGRLQGCAAGEKWADGR